MRLDHYLVTQGSVETRSKAQRAIKEGHVTVNNTVVTKTAYSVLEHDTVTLTTSTTYVSVGAYKLKHMLDIFSVSLHNLVVLDVGSSTGGFTQVALEYGAKKVIAVDVGTDQMHLTLRGDGRIELLEKTHFLTLNSDRYAEAHIVVCDVSFISSLTILERLKSVGFRPTLMLIKPQFEQAKVKSQHVIKDPKVRRKIIMDYQKRCEAMGVFIHQLTVSPITGGSGNVEYGAYLREEPNVFDVDAFLKEN